MAGNSKYKIVKPDTRRLDPKCKKLVQDVFHEWDRHFELEPISKTFLPLEGMELFRSYRRIGSGWVFNIKEGREASYVSLVELNYTYIGGKGGSYVANEFQVWGFTYLSRSYGHLVIRPETLRDKILELLTPVEMDFPEDKEFCSRFYIVTADQEKCRLLLTDAFRQELKQTRLKHFFLEVKDGVLIVGCKKTADPKEALALAGFIFNISELGL